jgi:phosphoribosylaminoimidazole synthetase
VRYSDAGVNIDRSNKFEDALRNVFGNVIGPFAGLFELDGIKIVSSTDGIGTKLKLEIDNNKLDAAAQDLVAMNVNDIFCLGAKPLFFLDYIGCHSIDIELLDPFIKNLRLILDTLNCKLLGGETAEMPLIYPEGVMDMVGFVVGKISTADKLPLGPEKVREGDIAIALPSSGPHSNGYTLINKLISDNPSLSKDHLFMETILKPTFIYSFDFVEGIHACAHITGGGLVENLPRIIPENLCLEFEIGEIPEIFKRLQNIGKIPEDEMLRTFNMGTGFVLIVEPNKTDKVMKVVERFKPRIAGKVVKSETSSHFRIR